jgi:pyrimidine-specific ribonucleoside hydrolase
MFTWMRILAVMIFLLAAIICILHVALLGGPHTLLSVLTALMLVLFPQVFILGTAGADLPYPRPWDLLLEWGSNILTLVGLLLWLAFYYIFPDGKVYPRWARWVAIILLSAPLIFVILSFAGIAAGEWVWVAAMLSMLAALIVGVILQVTRYRRTDDTQTRNQTRWVVVALALQPLLVFSAVGTDGPITMIGMLLQVLLPTLLPLALSFSILTRGLWGAQVNPGSKRIYAWTAGVLAIVSLVLTLGLTQPQEIQAYDRGVSTAAHPAGNPMPVVIDTDMAPDDWMAILYLLQRPDVEVKAITVTGTGEAHCRPGVRNAAGLAALAGANSIPVACGTETPLPGGHSFPDSWRQDVDALLGLELPEGAQQGSPTGGVELLLDTVQSSPEPVTVVSLGPLTNLAMAIEQDASALSNLKQVYIMGGALQVPGNVGFSVPEIDNIDAEWNIYADPLAARKVVESGAPVTLVPLDATNYVPADLNSYRVLQANRRTPEAEFVYQVLSKRMDAILAGYNSFWDPLSAAIAVDESIASIKDGNVLVITDEGPHSGATRLVARGAPVRYAKSADAERFLQEFVGILNQE